MILHLKCANFKLTMCVIYAAVAIYIMITRFYHPIIYRLCDVTSRYWLTIIHSVPIYLCKDAQRAISVYSPRSLLFSLVRTRSEFVRSADDVTYDKRVSKSCVQLCVILVSVSVAGASSDVWRKRFRGNSSPVLVLADSVRAPLLRVHVASLVYIRSALTY